MVSVASPEKAKGFVDAQEELPDAVFYCSQDLAAYKQLAFYDKFGGEKDAWTAATLPLKLIVERGQEQLQFMAEKTKGITKTNPVGLVSGKTGFSIQDAEAATQLGGGFAVINGQVMFAHRDRAVADHIDLDKALEALGV